ncbi:hypothetical protein [Streptomyces sp. NPDC007117]|uniref:hypothetical protein n=1 Tax=Streptomyces sp. NPDC007117 TaxID=3154314 RepID=UPI0033DA0D51
MRGQWESTVVIAVTNAAPHLPGTPDLPERTTTTRGTAEALRSLTGWAAQAGPDVDELVVTDQSRSLPGRSSLRSATVL